MGAPAFSRMGSWATFKARPRYQPWMCRLGWEEPGTPGCLGGTHPARPSLPADFFQGTHLAGCQGRGMMPTSHTHALASGTQWERAARSMAHAKPCTGSSGLCSEREEGRSKSPTYLIAKKVALRMQSQHCSRPLAKVYVHGTSRREIIV
ncbi:hypothetical protein GGTG_09415 [Gaeumannomyces tritici R3-111a-1]|uniref:Uncharacterized protein n=1 Tax=Gaeumannomyces tritici (strain R3-111a-1) TaxID=644352 RepID=J3P7C1_GAET3|nr:hypothetical protein GGTG_09415 [Gaeumannomyces tritici R3-111a-1]EJT72552.1 hypothetical protein GGTG_09415 [Gaeumannomyces tritici R3-111a-1]